MALHFAFRLSRFFNFEAATAGVFVQAGRFETYLRTADAPAWWTLREEGSWEAAAWRLRLTVSWGVPTGERLGDILAREVAPASGPRETA